MATTIPGTGSTPITIPGGTGSGGLAQQIINTLLKNSDSLTSAVGSYHISSNPSSLPAAPGSTSGSNALVLTGSVGGGFSIPGGWNYFLNSSTTPHTIAGNNTQIVTGSTGGAYLLHGNSTIAASGGNNLIGTDSSTGTYNVQTGSGDDTIFASGLTGNISTGGGTNVVITRTFLGGHDDVVSQGTHDLVVASAESTGGSTNVQVTGSSSGVLGMSGNLNVTLGGGSNSGIVAANGASNTNVNATGRSNVIIGGSGTLNATVGGQKNFVVGGTGNTNVSLTGAGTGVLGGTGSVAGHLVVSTGNSTVTNATIGAGNAATTVNAGSGADSLLLVGGSSSLTASIGGHAATVGAGTGPSTITATGTGDPVVFGNTGPLKFVGGAGTATLVGASGGTEQITVGSGGLVFSAGTNNLSTIAGGAGQTTIFGGSGSSINFSGAASVSGFTFRAGAGNETLNASASFTHNFFAGGAVSTAAANMIGGQGSDTFSGGAGSDTLTGGGGADAFVFFHNSATGHEFITDWTSSDNLLILGYGQSASTVFADSATGGGTGGHAGVTLTLSDNTKITFTNQDNLSQITHYTIT